MKTVILAINSQYVHTLLAPRYLLANCVGLDVQIIESNVNMQIFDLVAQIYKQKPDIIAISCYIFNIKFVRSLLQEIKLILPKVKIILGGYEVAFDSENYIDKCDYIIKGEGDFVFFQLLLDIENNTKIFSKIIEVGTVAELDKIASPYSEEYAKLGKDKILYFESCRGCPFCCSYCMSANSNGVRTFSLARVFSDLDALMKYEPKQIKFVDRTFNFDVKRAYKIFEYILNNFGSSRTNFHFEMAPELFSEQMFELLTNVPKGKFQFEIGVQSYNPCTLKRVGRNANIQKIEDNIKRLVSFDNIPIHVDLIAGLPDEDLKSFVEGFNRLFNLRTQCVQLGFLKMLNGSKIFNEKSDYTVSALPPYEIINAPLMTFDELLQLKKVEDMLEMYYNSGRFVNSIKFIVPMHCDAYTFFLELANFYEKMSIQKRGISANTQCDMLYNFAKEFFINFGSDEQNKEFILNLENLINVDYQLGGNARKWHRNVN